MRKSLAMLKFSLKGLMNNKANLIMCFAMPIGFYVLMGAMFSNYGEDTSKFLTQAMVPNFILIIISNALFNIFGSILVETQSTGNLEKYELLGISKFKYSLSLAISTFILILVITISFIIFVTLYSGNMPIPKSLLASIVLVLISCISQFSLMYFISSLVSKSSAYTASAMIIFFVQMFTGGLTFPLMMFSKSVQNIIHIFNPMAHLSTMLQNTWILGESLTQQTGSLVYILITSAVFIGLAALFQKLRYKTQTITPL